MRKHVLIFVGMVVCQIPLADAKDYYVDSSSTGANLGTYDDPWKSLAWNAPINTTTYAPGDRILFRKGKMFTGQIEFPGNGGSASAPVVFDSYSRPGDPDVKPIIAGGGIQGATFEIKNKRHLTIQNLEITNWPADPTVEGSSPNVRHGIRVTSYSAGVWNNIKILNNTIRKIRGITARGGMYGNAAIHFVTADSSVDARWDDILIQENDLSENTCIGIQFKSPPYYTMTNQAKWASNVRIRENTFQDMGADHIVLNGCYGPVVEYNKGYGAGVYGTKGYEMIAGMWTCYKTENTLFQYNEVAYTHNEYDNGISGDSKAFDVDYGTQGNHIFQYNYTHHNEGGVLIIMPREKDSSPVNDWVKTTIYRYNLSVNDGRNTGSCSQFGIWPVEGISSAHIYNNVFYSTLPEGFKFSDVSAAYYSNNVFYMPSAIYPSKPRFSNNAYYGHVPEVNDPYKVVADPKFVSPFPAGAGGDGDNIANTNIFKLQSTSPLINAGKSIAITPAPTTDYWGNALYQGLPDIGAYEYPSGGSLPAAPTAAATTVYQDNHGAPAVTYSSGWSAPAAGGQYSGGTQTVTTGNGRWVQVTFTGTNVSLYGKRSPSLGRMNVSVNGGPTSGVADCYWPIEQLRTELYRVTGLPYGTHTVRFTLNGKSPFSTGTYVGIDYFEVLPVTPPELPVVTAIDNTAGSHVGAWDLTGNTDEHYYNTTRSVSTTVGDYVEFTVTGTGARIYGPKAADRGKFTVTVNGANPVLVDMFSPVSYPDHIDHRMKLFEVNGLPQGTHTIRATVAASGGKKVVIDWVEGLVGGQVSAAPVKVDTNGTNSAFAYTGTWTHGADALYYNSTKSVSNGVNASVQFTFTGTKVSLFAKKAPGLGKLNVSIDGGTPVLVDCNAATTSYQAKIFESATLSPGVHTIKATIYDPGYTMKYVGVDYFEYQP